MGLNLNLTQYIPVAIYYMGWIIAFLSLFFNTKLGIYFILPLLPYQIIFHKMQKFAFGKDLNDILIFSILIGWLLRKNMHAVNNTHQKGASAFNKQINSGIILLVFVTVIGLIQATLKQGLEFDPSNPFLTDWKNYMFLPLVFFLTAENIRDKKSFIILTVLLIVGILGVDCYFIDNLRWMNLWHFSWKTRDMMVGLFVYLGANHYGAFFTHFVFIVIGIFLFDESKFRRIILAGIIAATVYALVYTYSRGAYVGFLAGMLFVALTKSKKFFLIISLVSILFFLNWKSILPVSVVERIAMTNDEEGNLDNSAATRLELWDTAWNMFLTSPVIGQGFNTFRAKGFIDTHNFYMKMLAELGIIGLISFLYLLYLAFFSAWRLYKKTNDGLLKGTSYGFAACVISAAVTNLFGDRWSYLSLGSYFWIFFGLVVAGNRLVFISGVKSINSLTKSNGQ